MTLTDEQRERIRLNKEKALERRKKRQLEAQTIDVVSGAEKRSKSMIVNHLSNDHEEPLEDFEMGLPDTVTKKEAKDIYCLPEGTLAVCSYVERKNPHHSGWNTMKLYSRAEIRRKARERWGGVEGLKAEREKRETNRFQATLKKTKDVFKTK